MAKLSFDEKHENNYYWSKLEEYIPGSREIMLETFLVLRIMGYNPNVYYGSKDNKQTKENKSSYYKYMIRLDDKKKMTIYIRKFKEYSHKIKFFNKTFKNIEFEVKNESDIREHLFNWLEKI